MTAPASLREIGRFAWRHRFHLPLTLVLPFFGILAHEGSHALMGIAFGAEIRDVQLWPGDGAWGRVWTDWPAHARFYPDYFLFCLAPHLFDLAVVSLVGLVAWRRERFSFTAASSLLLYGFCAPLADTANAAAGWLLSGCTLCDLAKAFGEPTPAAWLGAATLTYLVVRGSYLLQRKLYDKAALTPGAYAILASMAGLVVVGWLPTLHGLLSLIRT